jgi:hypothetical protein
MSTHRKSVSIAAGVALLWCGAAPGQQVAGTAAERSPVVGTADSQPLKRPKVDRSRAVVTFRQHFLRAPNDAADEKVVQSSLAQMTCSDLQGQVRAVLTAELKTKFGVTATTDEAKAVSEEYWAKPNALPDVRRSGEINAALAQGLTQVFEKGMDPSGAYEKYLKPLNIPESAWQGYLERGQTPEARARIAQNAATQTSVSAETLQAADVEPFRLMIEKQRLDDAIDEAIASADPTFLEYLNEKKRATTIKSPLLTRSTGIPKAHESYLSSIRAQWWSARQSEVKVVLTDQPLAQQCGASLGVR